MAVLCRSLARLACYQHPQFRTIGRCILAGWGDGYFGVKPQTAVLPKVVGRRMMTTGMTSDLQTMPHFTDFAIDERQLRLRNSREERASNLVLIVLNYKLPSFTPLLWKQARFRMCADGGANRLYDEMPLLLPHRDAEDVQNSYVPDVVKGDFDSIRPEVRYFYEGLGTSIIDRKEDQDTTDLHKCLTHVLEMVPAAEAHQLKILVVGGLGGRLDHELANMHVLHLFPRTRIVILSNHSSLFLLPAGFRHVIRPDTSFEGPHCGLIPLASPSRSTTTTGLQWNLDKTPMSFTTLVSTSNRLIGDEVTVVSDATLLWTTEIHQPLEVPSSD